jgi:hypothetical protein
MTEWIVFTLSSLAIGVICYCLGRANGYAHCYEDMTDRGKRRGMERDEARFEAISDD